LVGNLDGKPVCAGQRFQDWNEPVRELVAVVKNLTIEKWKLKDDGTKLLPKQMHGFEELLKLGFAAQQNLFMRDYLWYLHGENEALGCSGCPIAHGLRRGHA
jgi:hypothetical protein